MDELIKELRNIVSKKDLSDDYLLMNSKYISLKIESKNFHDIIPINNHNTNIVSSKKVLFVDGGNTVLFESADFCIAFIRVGGIVYSQNRRISRKSHEFYMFVKETSGKYSVKTYPETSFNNMMFDPEDESLRSGLEKCSVARIVSVIRRLAEIEYAALFCSDIETDVSYIVMDGTLEARYPFEDTYLAKLLAFGKTCALSKTCILTTKNGISITKKLFDLHNKLWYYFPIVTNNNPKHDAELYFVKLNDKTNYVFRFEIQKNFEGNVEELFSLLVANSNDPIFLGYPYGLIDVDQYVRISDDESRLLQTKLSVKLGKDWNELSKHLNSTNAHSILDKIKF